MSCVAFTSIFVDVHFTKHPVALTASNYTIIYGKKMTGNVFRKEIILA